VVLKQGVFNLVFHPHGWIKNTQVVELIDHAVAKHGKKVKFLNFREAQERIDKNLLGGEPLRDSKGRDNGVRVLDVDNDGFMDVVVGNERRRETRVWKRGPQRWEVGAGPVVMTPGAPQVRFGVLQPNGRASVLVNLFDTSHPERGVRGWHFSEGRWVDVSWPLPPNEGGPFSRAGIGDIRLRDVDGDGVCEFLCSSPGSTTILA